MVIMNYELAIVGSGAAGFTGAIYAKRAGIKTVVIDKGIGGGLANVSPKIENFPGFESISGMELMEKMKKHASNYADFRFNEEITEINKINDSFKISTNKETYNVKAIILCTGTEYRKLNVTGEKELTGKGVSYCATCDGFFFKDKKVVVVGGGNSALVEAVYLKQIGCKEVNLIHRRDQLRAEKAYEKDAVDKGVNIIYNTHIESINGKDKVEYLEIHDTKSGKKSKLPIDGIFISIGEVPQNSLAKELGLKSVSYTHLTLPTN